MSTKLSDPSEAGADTPLDVIDEVRPRSHQPDRALASCQLSHAHAHAHPTGFSSMTRSLPALRLE